MARPGRLHVPHATYFVVNRFRDGLEALAASPARPHSREELHRISLNRERFEALLSYLCRRWCARVHAYCWLPDSALLLIRIGHPPLESIMHTLRGLYSQSLRETGWCSGLVYACRYTALMIDPEDYLLDFARHIFWSPVHAGLCKLPLGYEHSSIRASLCDATLFDALELRGEHTRLGFSRFLTATPTPGFLRLLARGSRLDRRIAGSSMFVREARRNAARRPPSPAPITIIAWAASRLSLDTAEIVGFPRRSHSVEGRALVAWLATCAGVTTLAQVARWFGCEPSTLHRAVDHYTAARPELFNEQLLVKFMSTLPSSGSSDATSAQAADVSAEANAED